MWNKSNILFYLVVLKIRRILLLSWFHLLNKGNLRMLSNCKHHDKRWLKGMKRNSETEEALFKNWLARNALQTWFERRVKMDICKKLDTFVCNKWTLLLRPSLMFIFCNNFLFWYHWLDELAIASILLHMEKRVFWGRGGGVAEAKLSFSYLDIF